MKKLTTLFLALLLLSFTGKALTFTNQITSSGLESTDKITNQKLTFTNEAYPVIGARTATVTVSAKGVDSQTIIKTQDSKTNETVTDIDGNVYHTVTIGTQVWMVENLKTTKYNDGTDIQLVTDNTAWYNWSNPGYCWYSNDVANKTTYGALYKWYTVDTGKLCPTGWHVPTESEWTTLLNFLGGADVAGGKLKESGTNHWASPNAGATNENGFTALPGGDRNFVGDFEGFGWQCEFWCATGTSSQGARYLCIVDNRADLYNYYKPSGFSVRCIKNFQAVVPTISTNAISNIAQTSAVSGGNITADGGAEVTSRGVCWSTTTSPTITLTTKTTEGTGTGIFTSSINGLSSGTTYYVRAYATSSVGTSYGDEISFTTILAIGDSYQGGKIAYILQPGDPGYSTGETRGLIAATTDQNSGNAIWWGGYSNTNTGARLDGLFAGNANTNAIVTSLGGGSYAAQLCNDLVLGGYSDWYLPSKYELNLLYLQKKLLGGFTSDYYWSSTENNDYNVCNQNFSNGIQSCTDWSAKSYTHYVRAVRSFPAISINTVPISSITSTTASSGGDVLSYGCSASTARGVCWSTSVNPTIANSKTTNGTEIGAFTSSLTGLAPGTTYYVRAYATNSIGTAYGNEITFTTLATLATITTTAISKITSSSAASGGNIISDGGATVTARGVCWSTTTEPTIALSTKTSDGSGKEIFISSLTGLALGATYYVRAYATNSLGTAYGNEVTFSTIPTYVLTIIKTGTGVGTVTSSPAGISSGGDCAIYIPGTIVNLTATPIDGSTFTGWVGGGCSGTTGTCSVMMSSDMTITASFTASTPTITTTDVSSITSNTAHSGGIIANDGGSPLTARGICWNTSANPTIADSKTTDGNSIGSFTSSITGLTLDNTYYVRAYGTNSVGTAYGNEVSFKTALVIGDSFQGGKVAYILQPVDPGYNASEIHGLIAATSDQSTGIAWYNGTLITTGTTATGLGTGMANTIAIIASQGNTGSYAAKICRDYTDGVYHDWYLPSKDELTKLYINGTVIGGFSYGAYEASGYWSSTETETNKAWLIAFNSGSGGGLGKWYTYHVRAVRFFSFIPTVLKVPTVTTAVVSSITSTTAINGGEVTSDGGATVTARGVCWNTSANPTIADSKTSDGTATGTFTSSITGLTANTTYYVRAYATNSVGTSYGNEISFTTHSTSATINITAGGLSAALTAEQKSTLTSLTITGTIDARDVKCMRDEIPLLENLDLSEVTIQGFNGTGGTHNSVNSYPANEMPMYSFMNSTGTSKTSLKTIKLPNTIYSIGEYAFANCTGLTGSLSIGSLVNSIGTFAFFNCSGLSGSLIIPNSVTSIGLSAFNGCSGFSGSLTIGSSVTSIGQLAFYNCSGFSGSLTIPNSVTSLGVSAFSECTGFSGSLTIGNSITSIDNFAFQNCTGFTGNLVIGNSVTSIGKAAFYMCSGLSGSLTLPNSLTSIEDGAFVLCEGFKGDLTIPNSVISIGGSAFQGCSGFTGSLKIPNSVTSIGGNAFDGCMGFNGSLTIPNSLTSIGSSAFRWCNRLTSIKVNATIPLDLSTSPEVFNYVNKSTCTLYVPNGSKTAYQSANQWMDFINIVEMSITDLSIKSIESIKIYQNSVTNGFSVNGLKSAAVIRLFNINGLILINKTIVDNEFISTNSFPQGLYILKITTDEYTIEQKLVKK